MADFGVVVIGGGAVGLAIAARVSGRTDVVLLERHSSWGHETSSRNSEVIHAGFYYPEGSLKARLCVRGNALLYERCQRRGISHRRTTKIVTATAPEEMTALFSLLARGTANGVRLEMISEAEVH